jgi:hypothetical protein
VQRRLLFAGLQLLPGFLDLIVAQPNQKAGLAHGIGLMLVLRESNCPAILSGKRSGKHDDGNDSEV